MSLLNFKPKAIHSDQLERWLGPAQVAQISKAMREGGGPGGRGREAPPTARRRQHSGICRPAGSVVR